MIASISRPPSGMGEPFMLRVMQPLMRSLSVSTWSLTIMGNDAKVETEGAANAFNPLLI